jgi:hypothetical protein
MTTYKKEWKDEPGYANCLLVTICRIPSLSIELHSNQSVPNLEELSKVNTENYEWLKAQEFDYQKLHSEEIIVNIMRLSNITHAFWFPQSSYIKVHDVNGETGPVIERKIKIRVVKSKGVKQLRISL